MSFPELKEIGEVCEKKLFWVYEYRTVGGQDSYSQLSNSMLQCLPNFYFLQKIMQS